jgi:lipopolysaccharide heptosyltransferase II
LDREALVRRNRSMAQAFHKTPLKYHIRHALLRAIAALPVPTSRSRRANRILLIRPDHLGDVLLTTPAIRALRAEHPHTEIHALVGPWSANLLANYPEIDMVLTLPFPGFSRNPKESWRSPYQFALHSASQLRRIRYSSAIIFRPDHWWGAMLAFLAGIPDRVGYDLPDVAPFLTYKVQHQRQHVILQNLRLVEGWIGKHDPQAVQLHFPVNHDDLSYIKGYLHEWGIGAGDSLICIHPGSGTQVKQWLEEQWAIVADTLADQLDARIVITGSEQELYLAKNIAARMKHSPCITAGDTNIGQLAALFSRSRVVLGPDSGPLHLAAAVGAPTVALFGPADPLEFGTWGDPQKHIVLTSNIDCRPCRVLDWSGDNLEYHPCVREITVGRVLEAARRAAQFSL